MVWAANQFHAYFAVQIVPGLSLEAILDRFEHPISVCSCVHVYVVYIHVYMFMCILMCMHSGLCVPSHVCVHVSSHVYTCGRACVHRCTHEYTHVCAFV